jgi:hypothetical protein
MPELCVTELLFQRRHHPCIRPQRCTCWETLAYNTTKVKHNWRESGLHLKFLLPQMFYLLCLWFQDSQPPETKREKKKQICRANFHCTMYTKLLSYVSTIRHWTFYPIILGIKTLNWDSSVSTVTEYRLGRLGFVSWQKQESFLFSTVSRLVLRPKQPLIQRVPGALSPWVKQTRAWSWPLTSI